MGLPETSATWCVRCIQIKITFFQVLSLGSNCENANESRSEAPLPTH